jgi:hypothetical protein
VQRLLRTRYGEHDGCRGKDAGGRRVLTMVKISERDCFFADTWAEGAFRSGSGTDASKGSTPFSIASLDLLSAIAARY